MAYYQTPPDGGMPYTETNLEHTFPEPLNTFTSCFFLAIAIYWTFKLRGYSRQHAFLSIAVILLYIGGIGGTIYHGLRQWGFFIMMDWLPIMLLCVSGGVYFLARLTRWYYAVLFVLAYAAFQFFARNHFREGGKIQLFININYAILAAMVLLPVGGYLISTKFKNGRWVGFALLAFVLALTFRVADPWGWMAFGTHFLWHTFGAIAAFCMFQYIYLVNKAGPDALANA
jgi:hemolysin III